DQLPNRVQLQLADDRRQPGFDEIFLARVQHNRAAVQDQLPDSVELLRSHQSPFKIRNRKSEIQNVGSRHFGFWVSDFGLSICVLRIISSAIKESGSTRSASPARATCPGIPHTTDVASSCARIWPPASRTASQPRRPS